MGTVAWCKLVLLGALFFAGLGCGSSHDLDDVDAGELADAGEDLDEDAGDVVDAGEDLDAGDVDAGELEPAWTECSVGVTVAPCDERCALFGLQCYEACPSAWDDGANLRGVDACDPSAPGTSAPFGGCDEVISTAPPGSRCCCGGAS